MSTPHDTDDPLARERTDWAEDRTIMANERTFSAWMRTALGLIGVALGMRAVFGLNGSLHWLPKGAATLFLALALYVIWAARGQALRTLARLPAPDLTPLPRATYTRMALAMTLGIGAAAVILWLL